MFKLFFFISNFNEDNFVHDESLNLKAVQEINFEGFQEEGNGFEVFRRKNDLGGFDYLPFVIMWYPGYMPEVNLEKDRWLKGYDKGIVLFAEDVKNRQYVRHDKDGELIMS